jgi:hypothetical protein
MVEDGWEGQVGHLCDMCRWRGEGRNAHQWNSRLSHWTKCDLQTCSRPFCHSLMRLPLVMRRYECEPFPPVKQDNRDRGVNG